MQARKGNKVYQIDETQAKQYANQGFDIYEGKKLVKHATGKSVPIEEYERVCAELEALKKQLKPAKPSGKRPTKAELLAEAEGLGIEVPEGATNPEIWELIQAAK